jgi:hypothetical protein
MEVYDDDRTDEMITGFDCLVNLYKDYLSRVL